MTANKNGHDWRCGCCGALLGIQQGAEMHLRYKDLHAVVEGRVTVACRRCNQPNATRTSAEAA